MISTLRKSAALALVVGLALLGLAGGAAAVTVNGNADATILDDLTVNEQTRLDFGLIAGGATGGAVTVDSTGGIICGATLTCISGHAAGAFTVSGAANSTTTVTLPAGAVQITHTVNGTDTMDVTNFLPSSPTVPLDASGNGSFSVGATLNVNANQTAGDYTGTYPVTVEYQ